MTELEKLEILASLERGRAEILDALRDVTEEMAVRAPGPGKWSIGECVEHVAVSERYLFSQILASEDSATPLVNEAREARIAARGTDRTRKVESPATAQPNGRFSTLQAAVQDFAASRQQAIHYVRSSRDDLRSKITSHPLFGTVNCYEMLLLLAAHSKRHAKQIEEIKTAVS
ncbi:MAG: DinB family protein [Terracidiphilus sp.]|jgi:uncharacterized damage-inducible protein DinB